MAGTELTNAYVQIVPSLQGANRQIAKELGGLDTKGVGKKVGKSFGGNIATGLKSTAGVMAGALATVGVTKFFTDAVGGASDLSETVSKVGQVFGEGAGGVTSFASDAAKSLGQTQQAALDAASTFGTFGKAAGLSGSDLASFSTDFVSLATDLASFNNTSPEQAVEAIGAALRGEAEPMRSFGVLLDDATLRQEALGLGLIKTTKEALTPQQKVLAAQSAIYKQTSDAQGDFARTSGGLANQQRIASAQFKDFQTNLGSIFLPIATKVFGYLNTTAIPALSNIKDRAVELWSQFKDSSAFATLQTWLTNISTFVTGTLVPAFQTFTSWIRDTLVPWLTNLWSTISTFLIPAITNLWTWITASLIPAISGLVTWIVQNRDWLLALAVGIGTAAAGWALFTGAIAAWNAITKIAAAVQAAFNLVLAANPIGIVITLIAALVAGIVYFFTQTETGRKIWSSFMDWLKSAWEGIKSFFTDLWDSISSTVENVWNGIIDFFKGIPDTIKTAFSSVTDFITAPFKTAFNAVAGFWNRTIGNLSFKAPSWVPGIGGKGFSLPQIPLLASGAVAVGPTLAMVGEGRESEAILPLSRLDEMLANAGGRGETIVLQIDGREITRVVRNADRRVA